MNDNMEIEKECAESASADVTCESCDGIASGSPESPENPPSGSPDSPSGNEPEPHTDDRAKDSSSDSSDDEPQTDDRLVFLIPSVVALCFAITALLCHFGNVLIDLNNTCYYIYVNSKGYSDAEFIDKMVEIMDRRPSLSGYTIQKTLIGGYRDDNGELIRDYESYIIILMDVSMADISLLTSDMLNTFTNSSLLVEEVVMNSYFMTSDRKSHRWKDMGISQTNNKEQGDGR